MQQTFPCPKCGSQNVVGYESCGACGEKLIASCPHCGASATPGYTFCGNCGKGLFQSTEQQLTGDMPASPTQTQLAYYQEELKLKVFQEKEADLYNEAVAKYEPSAETDSEVAREMLPAARRQAESANEILRRRAKMAYVPDIASPMYFAWQVVYSDYLCWATAQAAAVSAVATGIASHAEQVQRLLSRSEKSRHKAEAEEKKLLKRLKFTSDDARKMLINASMAVGDEDWQPEDQLINELASLRRQLAQLQSSETQGKQAEEELRKQREHLDELVKERTSELQRANEQLQRELADRKRMEELLRESEEGYRQLVELAPDAVAVQIEGKIAFANNVAVRLIGAAEPEQLVGQPLMDFVAPDHRQMVQERVREAIEGQRTTPIACTITRLDGVQVDVEVVPTRVTYQDKPAVHTVFHHVTERDRMQEQLTNKLELLYQRLTQLEASETEGQRASQELRIKDSAIASSVSAIAMAGLEGNLTYVNPSFLGLWKYDDDKEVLARPAIEFWQRKEEAAEVLETVRDRSSWVGELVAARKDGSLFDVQVSASRITNEAGEPIGFMGSFTDMTQRKKMQEQVIIADRLASLAEMASGFAHELNNPLTGVIGLSQWLLDKKTMPADVIEDMKTIYGEAQRAAEVIRNFLAFARRHTPAKQLTNVNDIIQNVLKTRDYQHKLNNIHVNTKFATDLPAIMADPSQLHQVFLNLVINAEHFMVEAHNRGALTVTTERQGDIIKASLTDDGPGISEEDLAHVFDPFFTTKEVGQGTGLGLSICHGIVTEHGGRMCAESKLGKGTTFIVELPVVTKGEQLEVAGPDVEESHRVAGAKILVVDDEPTILSFLSGVLADQGHKVETVDNASDALERTRSERYRLILLDTRLSGMSGAEFYESAREIAESLARRVVFITGDFMGAETKRLLDRTKAPHIAQPFDAEQLTRDINHILAQGA